MLSPWELVRSRHWHPMASLEQSMMDFDDLANQMLTNQSPFKSFPARNIYDDDEFFKDLEDEKEQNAQTPDGPDPSNNQKRFSNYSYSSSSILDHQGRHVKSARRRFEDSNGRLKATHEREIDGKKLRSTWERRKGEGKHNLICSEGSPEEFENAWARTPFGEAQLKTIEQTKEAKKED